MTDLLCHFCSILIHLDISRFLHHLQVLSGLFSGHSQHPSSRKLPGQLIEEAGERFFLHGTSPKHILEILHDGFSEKLASLKGVSAFTPKSDAHGSTT